MSPHLVTPICPALGYKFQFLAIRLETKNVYIFVMQIKIDEILRKLSYFPLYHFHPAGPLHWQLFVERYCEPPSYTFFPHHWVVAFGIHHHNIHVDNTAVILNDLIFVQKKGFLYLTSYLHTVCWVPDLHFKSQKYDFCKESCIKNDDSSIVIGSSILNYGV